MPISDRIRARIRASDCFFAILPDKGFSVLSPMNDKVFPVPGSNNTGNKDIDDGLATLNYNSLATGDAFDFISGRYGARFYANANLSGQTPHHTVIFRAFVTDLTSVDEYPYFYRVGFFFSGGTSYLDHANLTCSIPSWLKLRFYQQQAIDNWKKNRCRGIFKMATGTGKTKTALSAAIALLEACRRNPQKPSLAIVIICPYNHLVTQWAEDCESFGIDYLRCFGSRHSWMVQAEQMVTALKIRSDEAKYACFITSNASFAMEPFQNLLASLGNNLLIIADEAHNLGAERQICSLPDHANFRIALSATPERWFDDEGTNAIQEYFGDTVIEFGLKEALDANCLTPYYYYPVIVELTDEEADKYISISEQLSKLYLIPEKNRKAATEDKIKKLLLQRARLQASAKNKTVRLFEIIREKYLKESHLLIYCGDGRVETPDEENIRQIEYVVKTLGNDLGLKAHPFTSEEKIETRNSIRARFASGDLQALVAIRCLDEGVDIPATKTAFILASSTNPRQFIQRRGRVLRLSPETGKDFAIIYDFIVILPQHLSYGDFKTERQLLKKELARVNEFANLARNKHEANAELRDLKKNYNLLDM